jgi:hypothetical protein
MKQFTEKLGQRLRRGLTVRDLIYRTPLYHPDVPIVVLWSEKSACTSIVKWFLFQAGLLDQALGHHRWIHNYENEVLKAREGYKEDIIAAIQAGRPLVKFVRDPYSRAYSGFLETCRRRVVSEHDHWSTGTRREILRHLCGSDLEIELAYSFNQFCDWMANRKASQLDPHLAPQFTPIENDYDIAICQLDTLADPFAVAEREYGLKVSAGESRIAASGHHHTKTPFGEGIGRRSLDLAIPVQREHGFKIPDVTRSDLAASRGGAAVRRLFEQDFDAYRYDTLVG